MNKDKKIVDKVIDKIIRETQDKRAKAFLKECREHSGIPVLGFFLTINDDNSGRVGVRAIAVDSILEGLSVELYDERDNTPIKDREAVMSDLVICALEGYIEHYKKNSSNNDNNKKNKKYGNNNT